MRSPKPHILNVFAVPSHSFIVAVASVDTVSHLPDKIMADDEAMPVASGPSNPIRAKLADAKNQTGRALKTVAKGGEKMVQTVAAPVKAVTDPILEGGGKVVQKVAAPVKAVTDPIRTRMGGGTTNGAPADEEEELPDVPPDTTLQNMDVIIKKRLLGVKVSEFYETVWSEGNGTDKAPFYEPWLISSGKHNVKVEDWEFAEDGVEFEGPWDGEKYTQKRVSLCLHVRPLRTVLTQIKNWLTDSLSPPLSRRSRLNLTGRRTCTQDLLWQT